MAHELDADTIGRLVSLTTTQEQSPRIVSIFDRICGLLEDPANQRLDIAWTGTAFDLLDSPVLRAFQDAAPGL